MDRPHTYDRKDQRSRIDLIDLLRALALFAIVLAHSHDHFNCYVYPVENQPWLVALNNAASWANLHLLSGKAFMLFSFLFGLSFFIQLDRAEARGVDFRARFAWRLVLLLSIGAFHTIFYDGDILSIFALQGLLLIPFYKAAQKTLLLTGLGCIVCLPAIVLLLKYLFETDYLFSYQWENTGRTRDDVYLNGSFTDVMQWNFLYGQTSKWKYIVESGRIGQTFGLFILGLWVGKMRVFENVQARAGFFRNMFIICLPGWLACSLLLTVVNLPVLQSTCNLFFIGGFISGISLLVSKSMLRHAVALLAPVGKTTLTSYVSQSVFFTFFFFGWGLQMAPVIGVFASMLAGAAFFLLQAVAAKWWLKRFRYGPLEWLWRSGTYRTWQPLRKS